MMQVSCLTSPLLFLPFVFHNAASAAVLGCHHIKKQTARGFPIRSDLLGRTHDRRQIFCNDIPVFGLQEIVHNYENGMERVTEKLGMSSVLAVAPVDTVPTLSESEARSIAIKAVEERFSGSTTIRVLEIELNIYIKAKSLYLVYRVLCKATSANTLSMPMVFVDAHNRDVLNMLETIFMHSLEDDDKVTYDEANNGDVGDSSTQVLLDIHDNTQTVLDFLENVCNMDSYDGDGTIVESYGNKANFANAYWNGSDKYFYYGNGNGRIGPLGVLDVVGHEIGHAITQFTSGLVYQYEPGALNEGASDIMGAMVQYYQDSIVTDAIWNIGEDACPGETALRYMHMPSYDDVSRDHYGNLYTGSDDHGGVHWNSGILNHWFYILSEGGQHHNPTYRTGSVIIGIGIDAAFEIWFQAWTSELISYSSFQDAAEATLIACEDLGYDRDSICASVQRAWTEVGILEFKCFSDIDCPSGELDCAKTPTCTGGSGQCSYDYTDCVGLGIFHLELTTDAYPTEVSWEVTHQSNPDVAVLSREVGSYYNTHTAHAESAILGDGCFTFTIIDSEDDGICCAYGTGAYSISYEGVEIASGGEFRTSKSHTFGTCPTMIFFEDFEHGWFIFQSGGIDATITLDEAYQGSKAMAIRDSPTSSKATTRIAYDVTQYSNLRLEFFYQFKKSTRDGEEFLLEYKPDGGKWRTAGRWGKEADFVEGQWVKGSVGIDSSRMSNIKLQFRCDARADRDTVYVDNASLWGTE